MGACDGRIFCRTTQTLEIARFKTKLAVVSEWLLVGRCGKSFPLASGEIELTIDEKAVFITFFDDSGRHRWRLNGVEFDGDEIAIDVAGQFGRERQTLRLVPRTPAAQLAAEIEAARLAAACDTADLAVRSFANTKISRVSLGEKGDVSHTFFSRLRRELRSPRSRTLRTPLHIRSFCRAEFFGAKNSAAAKGRSTIF